MMMGRDQPCLPVRATWVSPQGYERGWCDWDAFAWGGYPGGNLEAEVSRLLASGWAFRILYANLQVVTFRGRRAAA